MITTHTHTHTMLLLDRVSLFMHWDLSRTIHGPPRSAAYPSLCACKWAGGCVFAHLICFYRRFVLKRTYALGRSVAFHVCTHSEHSCSCSPRITANIWLSLHILLALTQISAPGLFFICLNFQQASPSSRLPDRRTCVSDAGTDTRSTIDQHASQLV